MGWEFLGKIKFVSINSTWISYTSYDVWDYISWQFSLYIREILWFSDSSNELQRPLWKNFFIFLEFQKPMNLIFRVPSLLLYPELYPTYAEGGHAPHKKYDPLSIPKSLETFPETYFYPFLKYYSLSTHSQKWLIGYKT